MQGDDKLSGSIEVDEFIVGGMREGQPGRSKCDKKEVAVAVQLKGRGISEARCSVVKNAGSKELNTFFRNHISKDAKIKTDKWRGYLPLKVEYKNITQEKSNPKTNFRLVHRFIMGFKGWLRGIHHNVIHLQSYLNEYLYRFNRHLRVTGLFEELISKMMKESPKPRIFIVSGS